MHEAEELILDSIEENLCSITDEVEGEIRTGETVVWKDWAEVDAETLLKEETEDADERFSTFLILVRAIDLCSWMSWGIVFDVENPPFVEITFWGARREQSSLQKMFLQSDLMTHWRSVLQVDHNNLVEIWIKGT